MNTSELSVVVPNAIWVSERPVGFGGVRLRARSTVLRLEDGGLLVHSPPEPTEEFCAALRALGELRWMPSKTVRPRSSSTPGAAMVAMWVHRPQAADRSLHLPGHARDV
jgi:hypothetical protein